MTQKELLYVEDAINHECNMIKYCEDNLDKLENEEIVSFLEEEISIHNETKERLLETLKEKSND